MESVIFLEVTDRKGNPLYRYRLDTFPATIGRSYRNTVILADRYVSPEHAVIVRDELGALWVEDRSSDNGLFRDNDRVQRVALGAGTRFRVGHTTFQVCTPDQVVEPVLREAESSQGGLNRLGSRSGALLAFALAVIVLMADLYLKSYNRVSTLQLLIQSLGIMSVFLVWACAWALFNRLVAQRFAFLPHLALASVAVIALLLLQPATEYLEFFFAPLRVLNWVETVAKAFFIAALLYGHLAIVGVVTQRRRWLIAGVTSAVIFGLVELNQYADNGWYDPAAERPAQLKPMGMGMLPTVDMDTFLRDAKKLKASVDSLAEK
ncbi:MAG: FHA domain-containing protein [Gemmatimonadota bacterium]